MMATLLGAQQQLPSGVRADPGLVFRLDAGHAVTSSGTHAAGGANVDAWLDTIGGVSVTSTLLARPAVGSSAGRPSIEFTRNTLDTGSDTLSNTSVGALASLPITLAIALTRDNDAGVFDRCFWLGTGTANSNQGICISPTAAGNDMRVLVGTGAATTVLTAGTIHANGSVIVVTAASGSTQSFLDGTAGSATINTVNFGDTPRIDIGLRPGSISYKGHVFEVLLYNSALAQAARQRVEGYLAWKWGMQAQLPSNHPWKSSAPTTP